MLTTRHGRSLRAAIALVAVAAGGLATTTASADTARHHGTSERLVVRGDSIVGEGECDATGCVLESAGTFRSTIGSGAAAGVIKLQLPDAFPNGEGGVCAPFRGQLVLGAGSPDRLTLALSGDSCQDGAGPPPASSFTGLADWTVVKGTGKYAKVRGHGTGTFLEDAADHERMTLIGRITR